MVWKFALVVFVLSTFFFRFFAKRADRHLLADPSGLAWFQRPYRHLFPTLFASKGQGPRGRAAKILIVAHIVAMIFFASSLLKWLEHA